MCSDRNVLLIGLLILFFFTSCSSYNSFFSIDKRKYRSGYHLETSLFDAPPSTSTDSINPQPSPKAHSPSPSSSIDTTNSSDISSTSPIDSPKVIPATVSTASNSHQSSSSSDSMHVPQASLLEASLKMLPVTWVPKLPPAPSLSEVMRSSEKEEVEETINAWAIVGFIASLTLILAPVGLVISILAIDQINRNPQKYEGLGLAWAGAVLGGIVTIIMLLSILMGATNSCSGGGGGGGSGGGGSSGGSSGGGCSGIDLGGGCSGVDLGC